MKTTFRERKPVLFFVSILVALFMIGAGTIVVGTTFFVQDIIILEPNVFRNGIFKSYEDGETGYVYTIEYTERSFAGREFTYVCQDQPQISIFEELTPGEWYSFGMAYVGKNVGDAYWRMLIEVYDSNGTVLWNYYEDETEFAMKTIQG